MSATSLYAAKKPEWTSNDLLIPGDTNGVRKMLTSVAASAKLKDPRNETTISLRVSSLAMKPWVSPAEKDWTRVLPRGLEHTSWYAADEYWVYRTRPSYTDEETARDVRTGDAKDVENKTRQVKVKARIVYRS